MKIPRTSIIYKRGDATTHKEPSLIAHVCNINKEWDTDFLKALSAIDMTPETDYHKWAANSVTASGIPFELGNVHLTRFNDIHIVASMLAKSTATSLDYEALRTCLEKLTLIAQRAKLPVVAPRFGSEIGGADWQVIEEMIEDTLIAHDIHVTVYTP